jgi:tRNA threonylcarbamoyladenosine biosynthesis protein TsaB
VALAKDGTLVWEKEDRTSEQHASLLGVFVAEVVAFAKQSHLVPDAVAVGSGPGSYTGLRIGISEAKGLCFGWGIPLIAIPTLQIITNFAMSKKQFVDFYCPMIDARRMEVYTAVYNSRMQLLQDVSAVIVDENSFSGYLSKGKVLFYGNGSKKSKSAIHSPNALFLDDVVPLASSMVSLSENAYREKRFEDTAYFEPFYLKEFVATIAKNKVLGNAG